MTLTSRILFAIAFVIGLLLWTGSITLVVREVYRTTEPRPKAYEVSLPVPFDDPKGVTPQMRIDATWDCLRRAKRPMGCD